MNLYMVTKASQEKERDGTILRALTRVFGVYTTEERAQAIAEKHQARVTRIIADQEKMLTVEEWINPGFFEGG